MSTEAHHQVIAVTGSIGSGKSTACRLLRTMGACVVSADDLAREAVLPGSPALAEIAARFGAKVLNSDGTLNRRALGSIVFENRAALRELEAITHPRIAELAEQEFVKALKSQCLLVVYDCPLLFEVGLEKRGFKAVVLIAADEEVSLERVTARDGISREDALKRLSSQLPMKYKREKADIVIENNGSLDDLEREIRKLWSRFARKAESAS